MFKNIGKKIKTLTRVVFIIECVVIIALGVIGIGMLIALRGEHYSIGGIVLQILLVIAAVAAAVILSWISSFVLYGFGELIDLAVSIEKNTRKDIVTDAAKEPNKKLEAAEQYLNSNHVPG